jgi:hypothetical protein
LVKKIISGGQTGADQGGLYAGKACGLETGGSIPKGFLTELGPMPELAEMFNLEENSSSQYPARTLLNAFNSDGTIRIATDFSTAGEKCTLRAIKSLHKPYFDVHVPKEDAFVFVFGDDSERDIVLNKYAATIKEVINWLQEKNINVLNVAGNREKSCPGLCKFVTAFLSKVFEVQNESSKQDL